jgi:hypothetical protein
VHPTYWKALAAALIIAASLPTVRQRLRDEAEHNAQAARQAQSAREQADAEKESACRADARCWGDRNIGNASYYCRREVEAQALHSVRWPQGWFAQDFPGVTWRDQAAGTLVYIGSAELQNGFGAWTPYIIGCLYDTQTNRAIRIELRPGQL